MPSRLFVCYAREDHKWAELLRSHLRPLESANYLVAFIDGEIAPGSNWNDEIRAQLANADLFLAITTVNPLNSDYAMNVELPAALERHRAGRLRLVPVIAVTRRSRLRSLAGPVSCTRPSRRTVIVSQTRSTSWRWCEM